MYEPITIRTRARRGVRRAVALVAGALLLAAGVPVLAETGAFVHVPSPSGSADPIRALDLELGKSLFLRTEFAVKRVSVGDPDILDVVVLSPKGVQLVPKAIGGTNVVLWDGDGAPAAVVDANVGSSFSHIERRLREVLGAPDLHVESAGEAVVLRGSVPSPVMVERAIRIAEAFFEKDGARKVVNAIDVGGNQQVMLEVILAEMNRSLGRNMTANWSTLIRSGGKLFGVSSFLGGLTAISDRAVALSPGSIAETLDFSERVDLAGTFINDGRFLLDLFLEAAQEKGLAKVLARPTLLARSGQSASFLAGGEVPIPVAQGGAFGSITIEFKDFGVGVEFAPTVLGPDRIHLEVSPEVSEVDFNLGVAVGGFLTPGFVTRRASTSVDLADGQSFAIAGLLQENVREAVEKYPILGDVPVLGALFRSVRFQRDETELVLIVTPRLVKPLSPDQIELPTDSFVEPSDYELYLLGALESQRAGGSADESEDEGAGLIGPSGHTVAVDMKEDE